MIKTSRAKFMSFVGLGSNFFRGTNVLLDCTEILFDFNPLPVYILSKLFDIIYNFNKNTTSVLQKDLKLSLFSQFEIYTIVFCNHFSLILIISNF